MHEYKANIFSFFSFFIKNKLFIVSINSKLLNSFKHLFNFIINNVKRRYVGFKLKKIKLPLGS